MITNRNEALTAGLAYRDTFSVWTIWDETPARRVFESQIDPRISNPAYVVHLWREFELAAFSGDTRLIARLMCLSYDTVRSDGSLIVSEGRVSALNFVEYANMQTSRQGVLL